MSNTRRSILTLVAMVALFGGMLASGSMAMAQDSGSEFQIEDLQGIQQGVARDYMGDTSALFGSIGTPGADASETPDVSSLGVFSVSTIVLKFDSSDNAKSGLDTLKTELTGSVSDQGVTLQEESVDGLSDNTLAYSAKMDQSGMSMKIFVVGSQQDEYIYYTIAMTLSDDDSAKDAAIDFTKFEMDADAGDGDGMFNEDGTSSGGLWDKLPAADDDVLNGLTIEADSQVYPKS